SKISLAVSRAMAILLARDESRRVVNETVSRLAARRSSSPCVLAARCAISGRGHHCGRTGAVKEQRNDGNLQQLPRPLLLTTSFSQWPGPSLLRRRGQARCACPGNLAAQGM